MRCPDRTHTGPSAQQWHHHGIEGAHRQPQEENSLLSATPWDAPRIPVWSGQQNLPPGQQRHGVEFMATSGPRETGERENRLTIFLEQFNQPLVYILMEGRVMADLLRKWIVLDVIFAIVLLHVIVGFVLEPRRPERWSLSKVTQSEAMEVRCGGEQRISHPTWCSETWSSSSCLWPDHPAGPLSLTSLHRLPAGLRLQPIATLRCLNDGRGLAADHLHTADKQPLSDPCHRYQGVDCHPEGLTSPST